MKEYVYMDKKSCDLYVFTFYTKNEIGIECDYSQMAHVHLMYRLSEPFNIKNYSYIGEL